MRSLSQAHLIKQIKNYTAYLLVFNTVLTLVIKKDSQQKSLNTSLIDMHIHNSLRLVHFLMTGLANDDSH